MAETWFPVHRRLMPSSVPVADGAFAHPEVDHDPADASAAITRRTGSRSRRKVEPCEPAAEDRTTPFAH